MSLNDYSDGTQNPGTPSEGQTISFASPFQVQNYQNGISGEPTNQYVLIPPKGAQGIAGFIFDYEGDDQFSASSDITDHFAEDNSSIQDQIALKPYMITLKGFVSELTLPAINSGLGSPLTTLQSTIQSVPAYLGKYTPQALQKLTQSASAAVSQVQNYVNTATQYLNQAQNIAALFGFNSAAPTKQQIAFITLIQLRDKKQVFNVMTPWAYFKSMAIENVTFIQPKESKTKSDIAVTMKQMRFVDIQSQQNVAATCGGRAASQYQDQSGNGLTSGTPITAPITSTLSPLGVA
jgi:hypothetical protein